MITVEELLSEQREWQKFSRTLDSGSYCEDASNEYIEARKIVRLYEELVDNLISWERKYDKR